MRDARSLPQREVPHERDLLALQHHEQFVVGPGGRGRDQAAMEA